MIRSGTSRRQRQKQRVTVLFRSKRERHHHRFGVNCFNIPENVYGKNAKSYALLTGGRDGSIHNWRVSLGERKGSAAGGIGHPQWLQSLEGHTGWVSSLVSFPVHRTAKAWTVASSSYDGNIKIWRVRQSVSDDERVSNCFYTLRGHMDYVRGMEYSDADSRLVSVGADQRIVLWDMNSLEAVREMQGGNTFTRWAHGWGLDNKFKRDDIVTDDKGNEIPLKRPPAVDLPTPPEASEESRCVHAVAISRSGKNVLSGALDGTVRLWDVRMHKHALCYRGHTDTVRGVIIGSDERSCASCSSDKTVRVWDLRMNHRVDDGAGRRPERGHEETRKIDMGQSGALFVFRSHRQPVWCLTSPEEKGKGVALRKIYSGGREGVLYEHNLQDGTSWPLFSEENSICSLKIAGGSKGTETIWCGTTSSTIHCWQLGAADEVKASAGGGMEKEKRDLQEEVREEDRWKVHPPLKTLEPPKIPVSTALARPVQRIKGLPAIVKYHVLNDKQHILVMNNGRKVRIELWDVMLARKVATFPPGSDFERVKEQLRMAEQVNSWFTVMISTGSLAIRLEKDRAFKCFDYLSRTDVPVFHSGLDGVQERVDKFRAEYRPLALAPVTSILPVHPMIPLAEHAKMVWEEIVSRRRYLTEALSLELEDEEDPHEPMRVNRGKILLRVVFSTWHFNRHIQTLQFVKRASIEQERSRGSRRSYGRGREFFDNGWSGIHICGQGSHCPSRYSSIFPLTATDLSTAMSQNLGLQETETNEDSDDGWDEDEEEEEEEDGNRHLRLQTGHADGKEVTTIGRDGQEDPCKEGASLQHMKAATDKKESGTSHNKRTESANANTGGESGKQEGATRSEETEDGDEKGASSHSTPSSSPLVDLNFVNNGMGATNPASGKDEVQKVQAGGQEEVTEKTSDVRTSNDESAETPGRTRNGDKTLPTDANDVTEQAHASSLSSVNTPAPPPPPPHTPTNTNTSKRVEEEGIFQSIRKSIKRTFWSTDGDEPETAAGSGLVSAADSRGAQSEGGQGKVADGGGKGETDGAGGGREDGEAELDGFAVQRQRAEPVHPKKKCKFTRGFDEQRRISSVDVELIISQVDVGMISHRQANSTSTETVTWFDSMHNMTGEEEDDIIPAWVYDAVWHNRDIDDMQRIKFFLLPHKDDTSRSGKGGNMVSILPSFQQSVLPSKATLEPFEAPAQVRATKVMKYLLHLFCEENVKKIERYDLSLNLLASRPDIGGEEPHAEHVAIPLQPWGRLVELSCQGKPVPPSMTLEAARRFLWKKFDSPLTLHYKILAKF